MSIVKKEIIIKMPEKELSKHEKATKAARRFEIIPVNIEYIDIVKNKTTYKRYKSIDVAEMRWSDLQEKLFLDAIPPGTYTFTAKIFSDPVPYHGRIKSVPTGNIPAIQDNKELNDVKKTISDINETLKSVMNKGGDQVTLDFMMKSAEKAHASEIRFYDLQLKLKDEKILELKGELKDLEAELDEAEKEVQKLVAEGGTGKTSEAILGIFNRFMPSTQQTKVKLSSKFDGSDIPEDILQILAIVDYQNIPGDKLNALKQGLKMIVDTLPKKTA
jgi:hypothetical protein